MLPLPLTERRVRRLHDIVSTGRTQMRIQFGVAPIAWTNSDLPQLGGETTLETCLAQSKQAGFSGTETGVKFPMDAAQLGPILQHHGLKLVSGWFSGELLDGSVEAEKARIENQLATFKALGAPVLVYAETTDSVQSKIDVPVSRRPRIPDERVPQLRSQAHRAGRAPGRSRRGPDLSSPHGHDRREPSARSTC